MKNLLLKKTIICLLILFAVLPLKAEYLFLKDGPVIKGKILNEAGDVITLQDEENKIAAYPRYKIMRISYSELALGKVYVQMKNGENFRGYVVDEDRDVYIFRYIIDKPEEFTVKRSDLLFIAARNPSGLKAKPAYTEIDLKWYPAFDKMNYFNIYLKKRKEDKYVKVDRSSTNSYQLRNLSSNTKYFIQLTGVDDAGTETLPSKELSVTTFARVEVHLKNGKKFKTNLAAEDNDKYTFRDDINKSKDFSIKRSDVLFITERYPSGLNGKGGYTDISLNWFYPYDKMKHFNIYQKKNTEDKYILAGKTGSDSFKLKGLKGNTNYNIRVTGVNEAGIETTPSNEILVTTLNSPPFSPSALKVKHIKEGGTLVEWKPATDPDGTVVKYKIYKVKNNKKEPAGEVKETAFKINEKENIYRIQVHAIDNMNAESGAANKRINQKDIFRIIISPAIIFPIDIFSSLGDVGFGVTVSFMAQNLFVKGFTLGHEFTYFYKLGKDSAATTGQNIHGMNLVTGTFKTGYSFQVTDFFFITPTVSFGAGYIDITYRSKDLTTERSARGFDPVGAVSVSFDFIVSDYFFIGINAGYGLFFENKKVFQFVSCGINLGVRF